MIEIDKQMRCCGGSLFRCNSVGKHFFYTSYWNKIMYFCDTHIDNPEGYPKGYPSLDYKIPTHIMNKINICCMEAEGKLETEVLEIIKGTRKTITDD